MPRTSLYVLAVCLLLPAVASGQQWAERMFEVKSHDFGTVARGARAEFAFRVHNPFNETVHIASVRTSCGCTDPHIEQHTLQPGQSTHIIAYYNTRTFVGDKGATLTVLIDRPYRAEVRLKVHGYIRSDVVFAPGAIDFGEVEIGNSVERTVSVTYAGREDWAIQDVLSANQNLEVELSEPIRSGNRTEYTMRIRLSEAAVEGYLQGELQIVTNDRRLREVALPMQGRVVSAFQLSPATLVLGSLKPGESVTKKLIVRGRAPFKLQSVETAAEGFEFTVPDGNRALHFIPVKFTAGDTGTTSATLQVTLQTESGAVITQTCQASATVE